MTDLESKLLEASHLLKKEGGRPNDVFVPGYGWVLKGGVRTDGSETFWEEFKKKMELVELEESVLQPNPQRKPNRHERRALWAQGRKSK